MNALATLQQLNTVDPGWPMGNAHLVAKLYPGTDPIALFRLAKPRYFGKTVAAAMFLR